jgi:hypothetical protein
MGHQFRVYLTQQDEANLISNLQTNFEIVLLRPVFFKDSEKTVDSLSELGRYPTDGQVGLTRPAFLEALQISKFPAGHSRIDLGNSPIIEFRRSIVDKELIRPGRFWYKIDSLSGPKSGDFKAWSGSVFRFLKNSLVKVSAPNSYAGKQAADKFKSGEAKMAEW